MRAPRNQHIANIPSDVWQMVLIKLDLSRVCMFGAASKAAATVAFSCELWKLVRLPKKGESIALGMLRLGLHTHTHAHTHK